ncbi:NAD-dependent epimerase/dehydratase family protein [Aeromonas hydrophila]|uniref:NAD-dependent epimerase/dehydratase family protein n=1 Tax=Aeromonas hydrophila TaxID=644 RepID=UPI002B4841E9|nr:NAD(P)-dependent oxidoreductase [Aeromonas hydrophila]
MKKILVCGGSGFIGRHLIDVLQNDGFDVALLSRVYHSQFLHVKEFVFSKISEPEIKSIINSYEPDLVVFLATQYDTGDIDSIIDVNIKLPLMIMDAISSLDISKRNIILTGSYWSFGSVGVSSAPLDNYAAAKMAIMNFAMTYSSYKKLHIIELVLYGTYGSNDTRGKILDNILNAVKNRESIKLSPGEQYLDLVHINDVCDGFLIAIKRLLDSVCDDGYVKSYALSQNKKISIREIIEFISYSHDVSTLQIGAIKYRDREVFVPAYIYSTLPEWHPKFQVYDYITQVLNDIE